MVHKFLLRISENSTDYIFFSYEIKRHLEKNFPPVIQPLSLSISQNIKENLDCQRAKPRRKRKLIIRNRAKRLSSVKRKIQWQTFSRFICFLFF